MLSEEFLISFSYFYMYPFGFFYENKHVKNGLSSAIKAVQTHTKII